MASLTPHRSPSVGAVIKKVLDVNPELGTEELAALVRQCISAQGGPSNEFGDAQVIDEQKAVALARESLR